MQSHGSNGIRFRVVTITPEIAQEMLDMNTSNRNISRANLARLRRALNNGEWMLNGEAVKIAEDGTVLDGQHRLIACVETGIAFTTLLIEGLPNETQDTMDTGKARSLSDVLSIRGEANAIGLAALIRRFMAVERIDLRAAMGANAGGLSEFTNHECLQYLAANPWVRDYVIPGKAVSRYTPLSGASAGVLLRVLAGIDTEDAGYFWDRLKDGIGLDAGDPILVLRQSFRTISEDVRGEKSQVYLSALAIKAWNAYREGTSISLLRWRSGGAKPEPFPEPR